MSPTNVKLPQGMDAQAVFDESLTATMARFSGLSDDELLDWWNWYHSVYDWSRYFQINEFKNGHVGSRLLLNDGESSALIRYTYEEMVEALKRYNTSIPVPLSEAAHSYLMGLAMFLGSCGIAGRDESLMLTPAGHVEGWED